MLLLLDYEFGNLLDASTRARDAVQAGHPERARRIMFGIATDEQAEPPSTEDAPILPIDAPGDDPAEQAGQIRSRNILGLERGFDDLERSGEITGGPRLFAVQAANCAAFAAAWAAGEDRFVPFETAQTIADGIANRFKESLLAKLSVPRQMLKPRSRNACIGNGR